MWRQRPPSTEAKHLFVQWKMTVQHMARSISRENGDRMEGVVWPVSSRQGLPVTHFGLGSAKQVN
jgi:hypothetical protein